MVTNRIFKFIFRSRILIRHGNKYLRAALRFLPALLILNLLRWRILLLQNDLWSSLLPKRRNLLIHLSALRNIWTSCLYFGKHIIGQRRFSRSTGIHSRVSFFFSDSISQHYHHFSGFVHFFSLLFHLIYAFLGRNFQVIECFCELLYVFRKSLVVLNIWDDLTQGWVDRGLGSVDIS